ncbi:MAG: hypothetical protein ABI609_15500 [Acidobacteriota bacterium]
MQNRSREDWSSHEPAGVENLSPEARRILRFAEAWGMDHPPLISHYVLEPMFTTDPAGTLDNALVELCGNGCLRRAIDGRYARSFGEASKLVRSTVPL